MAALKIKAIDQQPDRDGDAELAICVRYTAKKPRQNPRPQLSQNVFAPLGCRRADAGDRVRWKGQMRLAPEILRL